MAVVCALLYELRETPRVEAAALLKRAVAVADARPPQARRFRVRTRTQQFTRSTGVQPASNGAAAAIEARFQAAHYDWNDPLSARSFQAWRDGLERKSDEVKTVADPQSPAQSCYQIRTVAAEGALADATLTLRTADLRPVGERFEFRDQEWVELTEIADPTTRGGEFSDATNVEAPARPAEPPSRLAAITPGASAPISDELQVLSALHQIGADLGDPVEVALSGDQVVVSGVGIPPQRQKRIHEVLDVLPHVTVQLSEPAQTALPPETAATAPAAKPAEPAPPAGIPARVEQRLGSRAEFERVSARLLDANEAAMARAFALRALAQRFPAEAESRLTAPERQLLREMVRDHTAALANQLAAIEDTLVPILASLGGSSSPVPAQSPAAWQAAAGNLFRASRRVEVLLSVMLGVAPDNSSTANLPSDLWDAVRQLHASLDACQRVL